MRSLRECSRPIWATKGHVLVSNKTNKMNLNKMRPKSGMGSGEATGHSNKLGTEKRQEWLLKDMPRNPSYITVVLR